MLDGKEFDAGEKFPYLKEYYVTQMVSLGEGTNYTICFRFRVELSCLFADPFHHGKATAANVSVLWPVFYPENKTADTVL